MSLYEFDKLSFVYESNSGLAKPVKNTTSEILFLMSAGFMFLYFLTSLSRTLEASS